MSGMTCQQRDSGAGGVGGRNAGQGRGAGSRRLVREEEHGVAVGQVVEVADENDARAALHRPARARLRLVRVGDHLRAHRLAPRRLHLDAQLLALLLGDDDGAGLEPVLNRLSLHHR